MFKPLSGAFAGMAIKLGDYKFMMVNHEHSLGKQHFTVAHEIYHLFIQENFTSQRCVTGLFDGQNDLEEKKADIFAANLLLPESGVLNFIPKEEREKKNYISPDTIFRIQQYYSVSIKAVIFRLFELGLVDSSYFENYKSGNKDQARQLGYDTSLLQPGNKNLVIGDYAQIAKKLFNKKLISESYFFELMNSIGIDPLAHNDNADEQ
jgi:Zn-dependent peptidase ImmA (M78 family)